MSRAMTYRILAAAAVLVLASCSQSPQQIAAIRQERAELASQLNAQVDAPQVTEWSNANLPVPFSPLTSAGGNVLYRTVEDQTLYLVAVAASSGRELWRHEIDPVGQLRGTSPPPLAIAELAIVVETESSRFFDKLTAFDASTGEELWSETLEFNAVPAFRCGDDVCTRFETTLTRFEAVTGMSTVVDDVSPLNTIFVTTETYAFGASPRTDDAATEWLGLHHVETGEEFWRVSMLELGARSGIGAHPNFGWGASIFQEEGVIALFVGSDDPNYAGAYLGIDITTGRILWTLIDEQGCIFSDYGPDDIVVCTADESSQNISRIDVTTGTPTWTRRTGDVDDFVWANALGKFVVIDGPDGYVALDIETGEDVPASDLQLCGFAQPWQGIEVFWADEPVTYRAASHPALCDSELGAVTAAKAVAADDGLANAALLNLGNGWSVAVDIDGSLSGTYTG